MNAVAQRLTVPSHVRDHGCHAKGGGFQPLDLALAVVESAGPQHGDVHIDGHELRQVGVAIRDGWHTLHASGETSSQIGGGIDMAADNQPNLRTLGHQAGQRGRQDVAEIRAMRARQAAVEQGDGLARRRGRARGAGPCECGKGLRKPVAMDQGDSGANQAAHVGCQAVSAGDCGVARCGRVAEQGHPGAKGEVLVSRDRVVVRLQRVGESCRVKDQIVHLVDGRDAHRPAGGNASQHRHVGGQAIE